MLTFAGNANLSVSFDLNDEKMLDAWLHPVFAADNEGIAPILTRGKKEITHSTELLTLNPTATMISSCQTCAWVDYHKRLSSLSSY